MFYQIHFSPFDSLHQDANFTLLLFEHAVVSESKTGSFKSSKRFESPKSFSLLSPERPFDQSPFPPAKPPDRFFAIRKQSRHTALACRPPTPLFPFIPLYPPSQPPSIIPSTNFN